MVCSTQFPTSLGDFSLDEVVQALHATSNAVASFIDGDVVSEAAQFIRCTKASESCSDHHNPALWGSFLRFDGTLLAMKRRRVSFCLKKCLVRWSGKNLFFRQGWVWWNYLVTMFRPQSRIESWHR